MTPRLTLLSTLALCGAALAEPRPAARIVPAREAGATHSAIAISIVDDQGRSIPDARIRIADSAATEPGGANIFLTAVKDGKETPLAAPKRVAAPDYDRDGLATAVNIILPAPAEAGTSYKVMLRPAAGRSAITYRAGGRRFVITEPLVLEAGEIDKLDVEFVERTKPLGEPGKPLTWSVEVGGGDEGALFSLRASYARSVSDNQRLARVVANLEADLSPTDGASDSILYGRIAGDFNGLWQVPFREGGFFQGSAFYGLVAAFESDQEFSNWDASVGATGWWFVNCAPLTRFGDFLRISNDPDTPVHPLALKLSAQYVYAGERDEGLEDPAEFRATARLIWLNRIYTAAPLPFMDTRFDVNLLIDIGAAWEPQQDDFHPTARFGLEFEPIEFEDRNLAFTLTYAEGEFSPTFVDENAFLAGMKLRF